VVVDLGLRLLELSNKKQSFSIGDLEQSVHQALLASFVRGEFVSVTDGSMSMGGRQRLMLAEKLIHGGADPKKVSRFLSWQEFEEFAADILHENGFSTRKHFVFKATAGRREIDVLAWSDTFILAIDCKHWRRGFSQGRMEQVAEAQVERVVALAHSPELLYRVKVPHPMGRAIIPAILGLGEPRLRLAEGVPVVSVSKLLSFIYGVSPVDDTIRTVRVSDGGLQSHLT